MAVKIPVREIEPGDIHPCVDQSFHDGTRFRRRSDGGDNFCFLVGKLHDGILLVMIHLKGIVTRDLFQRWNYSTL
jgi:hypothetical protein